MPGLIRAWISHKTMASPKPVSDGDRSENDGEKCSKLQSSTPSWGKEAKNGEHLWCRTSASGDLCYVSNEMCADRGPRLKCSACKILVHAECLNILLGPMQVLCRMTFQDAEIGSYRENTVIQHHWIAARNPKGRCRTCSKTFGGKVASLLNDSVAMNCSWCKQVCHGKESCFGATKSSTENCTLGEHANLIVPPTWIVKLSEAENSKQAFAVKPIPSSSSKPLLVFINPKSGGNQGAKLLRTFQWLLNPRQVFDLTEGGPAIGLELYKRVPNLRILACGGDGTVGWILSVLDDLKVSPPPPVAVLPLGTGNDLARSLGWGGGYTDEPLSKILMNVQEGEITKMDRWVLRLIPNPDVDLKVMEEGRQDLPLNVVNNYFSLGVDARIALEFHEAREARPGKFNSRFRNKMFYGQAGGKDLIQRKWKDLCSYITLECDGQDMTGKLREMKVHSILFLNISSYGGGTKPWGASGLPQFQTPTTDDGLIEVIGLTTYQLPLLQAGGHGTPIAQCKRARLVTLCTIPVQVDGEPCRLMPSVIDIELLNTVNMIARTKRHGISSKKENVEKINLPLKLLTFQSYESEHQRKEVLEKEAVVLGSISISYNTDLSEIRPQICKLLQEKGNKTDQNEEVAAVELQDDGISKMQEWWFLDSCSGEKFFRIDDAQEHLYYVNDICEQELYIVEDDVRREEPNADDVTRDSAPASHEPLNGLPGNNLDTKGKSHDVINEDELDLIGAAKMGNLEQVARLHSQGHSITQRDHEGRTALHHAAFIGNVGVVRYLAAYAPISVLDAQDDIMFHTALHRAATRMDKVVCSILVSAGASLDIKDKQGYTAQQLAEIVGDKVLANYLESVANTIII